MGPPPASGSSTSGDQGFMDQARESVLISSGLLVGLWIILGFFTFLIFAFATQRFTLALIVGTVGGLAEAAAIGWNLGLLAPLDSARRKAPLWVRLLLPIPLFVFLLLLSVVGLGALIPQFVLMVMASILIATLGTGAVVYALDLFAGVPDRVRGTRPLARLLALAAVGVVVGVVAFTVALVTIGDVALALALFLPGALAGSVLAGILSGWSRDARIAAQELHLLARIATFVLLLVLFTLYFALLVGRFLPNATIGYAVSIAISLALLIPITMWARTWRDAWGAFVDLGEENRILAVLPAFPLGAVLTFLLIVVLTSNFEIAYVASLPAGLGLFLLVGLPFGVTQQIAPTIRRQNLPARTGIFLSIFILLALYAYLGLGFFLQVVEIALLAALIFAGVVLGLVIWLLDLGAGVSEEFESYGPPAEAGVLGLISIATFLVSFLALALALDDFRIAFLLAVIAAAVVNYLIAHSTGLIFGMREALEELPWWGDLLILAGIFVVAFLYGAFALGVFYNNVTVAYAFGAILATATVIFLAKDLEVGDDLVSTADERRDARVAMMTLTFLGGFLVGMYVSAALLSAAGSSLFGLPFFVALITGTAALLFISKRRGWGTTAMGRIQSRRDRVKVAGGLLVWLAIGTLTGFALQSVPIGSQDLGLGSSARLPLTLTLAAGLLVWSWLPVVIFRAIKVERTPVKGTLEMSEKPKFWASLGWGILVFIVTAAVLLSIIDNPVIGMAGAILAGYATALLITAYRRRGGREEPPDSPIIDNPRRADR